FALTMTSQLLPTKDSSKSCYTATAHDTGSLNRDLVRRYFTQRNYCLFHSIGKSEPAFCGSSLTPAISAARERTGSPFAASSEADGNNSSSGMTPACSKLLPS